MPTVHPSRAIGDGSGSAALNMCHVACGKLDCYFEDGYGGPWDVAAGLVIVREVSRELICPKQRY